MEKEKKKKLVKTAIAGITSASVLLGTTFNSPEEIKNSLTIPESLIDKQHDYSDDLLTGLKKKEKGKNVLKNLIYKIPIKIRTILFIPMWFLGTVLISLIKSLFKIILIPAIKISLGSLLHIVVFMLIILICIKLLFPNLPLSKIFNKRNILLILFISILMALLDFFIPLVWKKYIIYNFIFKFVFGLLVIGIIMKPYIKRKLQNAKSYEIIYENQTLELNT